MPARAPDALVHGSGVAGVVLASTLAGLGWRVTVSAGPAARAQAPLLLNDVTLWLLADAAGVDPGGHAIVRRLVAWGAEQPVVIEAPARVVGAADLSACLLARLAERWGDRVAGADGVTPSLGARWDVDATGRLAARSRSHAPGPPLPAGRRRIASAFASLRPSADRTTSVIESLASGWIFLTPVDGDRALVQAMSPLPAQSPGTVLDTALAASRLLPALLEGPLTGAVWLPAAPQLLPVPAGRGWIAVGDAAMAWDPVAGEGVGNALRGALLAAHAMHACDRSADGADALEHYRRRLAHSFTRHLSTCLALYRPFTHDPEWRRECAAMAAALHACDRTTPPEWRYRLDRDGLSRHDPEATG